MISIVNGLFQINLTSFQLTIGIMGYLILGIIVLYKVTE